MFLVKLIDLFVGAVIFLFVKDQRKHNPSIPLALGMIGTITLVAIMVDLDRDSPRRLPRADQRRISPNWPTPADCPAATRYTSPGCPPGGWKTSHWPATGFGIGFRLDKAQALGNRTTVTVRLRTVLGKRFLDVMPAGNRSTDWTPT